MKERGKKMTNNNFTNDYGEMRRKFLNADFKSTEEKIFNENFFNYVVERAKIPVYVMSAPNISILDDVIIVSAVSRAHVCETEFYDSELVSFVLAILEETKNSKALFLLPKFSVQKGLTEPGGKLQTRFVARYGVLN